MNHLATTMRFTLVKPGIIARINLLDKDEYTLDKVLVSSTVQGDTWF
jgi:hypothetical protein